jgi:hypothetical protein
MTIPPWLNITPQTFLGALEGGTNAGTRIAQMRQDASARQAALDESADQTNLRQQIARDQMLQNRDEMLARSTAAQDERDISLKRLLRMTAQDEQSNKFRGQELAARSADFNLRSKAATDKEAKRTAAIEALRTGQQAGKTITQIAKDNPEVLEFQNVGTMLGIENPRMSFIDKILRETMTKPAAATNEVKKFVFKDGKLVPKE